MDDDDNNNGSDSSLSSFISIGTAEAHPVENKPNTTPTLLPVTPASALPYATATASNPPEDPNPTLAELIDMHRRPHPHPHPRSRPRSPAPALEPPSPHPSHYTRRSQDTMHELKRNRDSDNNDHDDGHDADNNRLSIIDPTSVKVSFVGTLSDMPVSLPLEEGLQRLYSLYHDIDPDSPLLPRSIQITDLPLLSIATTITSHILALQSALAESTSTIETLTRAHEATKSDLANLELQRDLRVQEVNMCSLSASSRAVRLRLTWQQEELARVNGEKEVALATSLACADEAARLRGEVDALVGLRGENERLRGDNEVLVGREEVLSGQLEDVVGCLDRARWALRSVPGPMRRLCARVLVPSGGGGRLIVDGPGWWEQRERDKEGKVDVNGEGEGMGVVTVNGMGMVNGDVERETNVYGEKDRYGYGCRGCKVGRGHDRRESRSFF